MPLRIDLGAGLQLRDATVLVGGDLIRRSAQPWTPTLSFGTGWAGTPGAHWSARIICRTIKARKDLCAFKDLDAQSISD